MKKLLSVLGVAFIAVIFLQANKTKINPSKATKVIKLESKQVELPKVEIPKIIIAKPKLLVEAMIQVESGGNDSIIGDKHIIGGEAVGCLQIRPIMVKEINHQLKRNGLEPRFTMDDRYSRNKSIEMFNVYVELLHQNHSDEHIARNWNGGPKGYKRKSTEKYWVKIQREMIKDLVTQK
jgi:hypothetical protein